MHVIEKIKQQAEKGHLSQTNHWASAYFHFGGWTATHMLIKAGLKSSASMSQHLHAGSNYGRAQGWNLDIMSAAAALDPTFRDSIRGYMEQVIDGLERTQSCNGFFLSGNFNKGWTAELNGEDVLVEATQVYESTILLNGLRAVRNTIFGTTDVGRTASIMAMTDIQTDAIFTYGAPEGVPYSTMYTRFIIDGMSPSCEQPLGFNADPQGNPYYDTVYATGAMGLASELTPQRQQYLREMYGVQSNQEVIDILTSNQNFTINLPKNAQTLRALQDTL